MKYLKRSAGYIVIIIALLFLQAYCDLSLPNYTSNIINVGIQQNGIEDSVPEKIRKTSMDSLKLFMEEDDAKTVDGFYEEEGDDLVLKDKISKDGKVPVMGRITVNGTQAGFSCKLNIDPALWDEKTEKNSTISSANRW